MLILTIRTDKPEAELGLYVDDTKLQYEIWTGHRQLAETIHLKLKEVLSASHKQLSDIEGVVVFAGPGSFTGLRIGISVANALADSLSVPIVGTAGQTWLETGIKQLVDGQSSKVVIPQYGALPNITQPKH